MDYSKCKIIQSRSGGYWENKTRCWVYPIGALTYIQEQFPNIALPDTIEQFFKMKRASEIKFESANLVGGDWDHPFLMKHQKIAVEIARCNPGFAYFFGTGTGKTIMSLAIFDDRPAKTLVICPLPIIKPAWITDAKDFFPHIKMVNLHIDGSDPGKRKLLRALNSDADIFIVNFETFKILYETLKQIPFKRIFVDESSKMKRHDSQITEDILSFCIDYKNRKIRIPERYVLTGTPAPNTPLEYYPQIELVKPQLLAPTFSAFKSYYFEKNPDNQYDLLIKEDKMEELMNKIKQVAIFLDKEDCLDLPPLTITRKDIEMTPEQAQHYKTMEHAQLVALSNEITVLAANKLSSIMKLRQITAGFILDKDKIAHFISLAKLKVLEEVLDEIGGSKQVIIWIQFHEEVNLIKKMIEKKYEAGRCRALYGGTKRAESGIELADDENIRDAVIREFQEGKFQYLICHPRTAMYGLTFVNCHYAVYFSLSHSYEEFHQSRDRIQRKGQENNMFCIFLTCVGTIDLAIYRAVKRKQKVSSEMLNYIRIVKGGGSYDPDDKN